MGTYIIEQDVLRINTMALNKGNISCIWHFMGLELEKSSSFFIICRKKLDDEILEKRTSESTMMTTLDKNLFDRTWLTKIFPESPPSE